MKNGLIELWQSDYNGLEAINSTTKQGETLFDTMTGISTMSIQQVRYVRFILSTLLLMTMLGGAWRSCFYYHMAAFSI